jgi:hypothetical protein
MRVKVLRVAPKRAGVVAGVIYRLATGHGMARISSIDIYMRFIWYLHAIYMAFTWYLYGAEAIATYKGGVQAGRRAKLGGNEAAGAGRFGRAYL